MSIQARSYFRVYDGIVLDKEHWLQCVTNWFQPNILQNGNMFYDGSRDRKVYGFNVFLFEVLKRSENGLRFGKLISQCGGRRPPFWREAPNPIIFGPTRSWRFERFGHFWNPETVRFHFSNIRFRSRLLSMRHFLLEAYSPIIPWLTHSLEYFLTTNNRAIWINTFLVEWFSIDQNSAIHVVRRQLLLTRILFSKVNCFHSTLSCTAHLFKNGIHLRIAIFICFKF